MGTAHVKQNILRVVGEEHHTDVLPKRVSRAVLDKLSDALEYWFLDDENMMGRHCSEEVCDAYWKEK